jgi:hypothetical protein
VENKPAFNMDLLKDLRSVWQIKFQTNANISKLADENYVPNSRQTKYLFTPSRFSASLFFMFLVSSFSFYSYVLVNFLPLKFRHLLQRNEILKKWLLLWKEK